jgi:redox-sensitive bicupin YhaK (pirin superfamily)
VNDDKLIQDHSLVIFAKDGEAMIKLEAEQNARFLVLTGQPLNEPFQGHGPFVMNDKAEIIQAMHDFNSGQFGQI